VRFKNFLLPLSFLLVLMGCSSRSAEIDELRARVEKQNVGPIVSNLYSSRGFEPIWISNGKKQPALQQFFALVDDRSHGLPPEAFGVDALRPEKHTDLIQFEISVTSALVRYASAVARQDVDLQKVLNDTIASNSVPELANRLAPVHDDYSKLRSAWGHASEADRPKIALNMNRWRKVPDDLGVRHIRVNVPAFELQVRDGNQVPLRMKVVVGANDSKTPLFSGTMKYVVFSPYWNIPDSILMEEMVPKLRKDPEYATRENLEVVRISGKRVEVIDAKTIDWDDVDKGDIQLRQKPGVKNSLGLVKFMFPNEYDVYLHDTPADNLFGRLTRNLSHGCIRLEKPQELAEYVLRDQPEWTTERIQMAMRAGEEKHVSLKDGLPVHILYFTAWVDEAGVLRLENDVYGYDTTDSLMPGDVLD
jgi:murein L,D-transpeptidase YcbB/YkuD